MGVIAIGQRSQPVCLSVCVFTQPVFSLALVRGYVDTWIRGYVDTWISGYVDTWTRGYVDTWLRGYVRGYVDTWLRGYVDTGSTPTDEPWRAHIGVRKGRATPRLVLLWIYTWIRGYVEFRSTPTEGPSPLLRSRPTLGSALGRTSPLFACAVSCVAHPIRRLKSFARRPRAKRSDIWGGVVCAVPIYSEVNISYCTMLRLCYFLPLCQGPMSKPHDVSLTRLKQDSFLLFSLFSNSLCSNFVHDK